VIEPHPMTETISKGLGGGQATPRDHGDGFGHPTIRREGAARVGLGPLKIREKKIISKK
jgi:hypothetical protein